VAGSDLDPDPPGVGAVVGVPLVFKFHSKDNGVSEEMQGVPTGEEEFQPFTIQGTLLNPLKLSPGNLRGVRV